MTLQKQILKKWWNILTRFDSIVLGDNPFFGIDHLSNERSRKRSKQYQNFDLAVEIIKSSYELGIRDMMVGTRPRLNELIKSLKKNSNLHKKFKFHAVLPYTQDYVLKLSEKGMTNTIKDILIKGGLRNDLKILGSGSVGFLKKDFFKLFKVFIDIQMFQLNNLDVKTVYLHPVLTDLALALNMRKVFEVFREHLHDSHKVKAGLCTKNFPILVSRLDDWDLEYSYIMTSFNKAGFLMNPSIEECEKTLSKYDGRVMAMNVFAGGYLGLDQASEYIMSQSKIRDIVVGISSVEHAKQTFTQFVNPQK